MQARRLFGAAAAVAAMVLVPAGKAQAGVSVTVTGDDGNPLALSATAPVAIRNMDVKVIANVDKAEGARWSMQVVNQAGASVSSASTCYRTDVIPNDSKYV